MGKEIGGAIKAHVGTHPPKSRTEEEQGKWASFLCGAIKHSHGIHNYFIALEPGAHSEHSPLTRSHHEPIEGPRRKPEAGLQVHG